MPAPTASGGSAPAQLRLEAAPALPGGLIELRGHPVLLYFFDPASWVSSAVPRLDRARGLWAATGLEVIGVTTARRSKELEDLLAAEGVTWRVFHETDERTAEKWVSRFHGKGWCHVELLDASGGIQRSGSVWGLRELLEERFGPPPPGAPVPVAAVVRGRLLHAGRPATEFTDDGVNFGPFRDEWTGRFIEPGPRCEYDHKTAEFRFYGLPVGEYGVYLTTGPFWHNFVLFHVTSGARKPVELALTRRIYLRSPVDTSRDVMPAAEARHLGPVTFAWDAIPGATAYNVEMRRLALDAVESRWEIIPSPPVENCRVTFDLPEAFEYEFTMTAKDDGGVLAHLRVYQDGLGNRYRFRIGPPLVEREGPRK